MGGNSSITAQYNINFLAEVACTIRNSRISPGLTFSLILFRNIIFHVFLVGCQIAFPMSELCANESHRSRRIINQSLAESAIFPGFPFVC